MISSQASLRFAQQRVKMKVKKSINPRPKHTPGQLISLRAPKLVLKPLSKLDIEDNEMKSFLALEAKKVRADRVRMNRLIKQQFNLSKHDINKLTAKVQDTKRKLVQFAASADRLRRLLMHMQDMDDVK